MTSAITTTTTTDTIAIEHARKVYKRRRGEPIVALDDVSLTIEADQWVALLGPNGSGKSTLMRLLAGLDEPDAGRLSLLGHNVADARSKREASRALGVVFQHVSLDPLLTIRENLRTQAALFGYAGAEAGKRVSAAAARMGVSDRLDDRVRTLSGGLARRADLARALVHMPRVLLLDEPTTGLDHASRMSFLDALDAIRSGGAMTIVMSTHLMDEAERADRVAMLDRGSLVGDDAPAALRRSHPGRVLRCQPKDDAERLRTESILAAHAVDAEAGHGVTATIQSDETAMAVAGALAQSAIAFELGPPTLADVYLSLTGRRLHQEDDS